MFFIILYSLLCCAEKQSNETFVSQTISANVQLCIVHYRATCSSHGDCLELQNGTTICFCDANFTDQFCETSTLLRSILTSHSLTHSVAIDCWPPNSFFYFSVSIFRFFAAFFCLITACSSLRFERNSSRRFF